MRILFVCSGNICRSPMAAECLRHLAAREGRTDLVIDSAGTLGIEGAPASPEAIQAMREIGLDLSGHRSRGILARDVRTAGFVIGMAREHLTDLATRFPASASRPFLVRAFEAGPLVAADAPDLADPIGEPVDVYRRQVLTLTRCMQNFVAFLERQR